MKSLIPWRRGGTTLEPFWQEVQDFVRQFPLEPFALDVPEGVQAWAPRVDIAETEKEVVVKADLPGVDPKDVDITIVEGCLCLKGVKKEEHEEKKKNYHRIERCVGNFQREITLLPGIDPEKISAVCTKGVITVIIPKKPEVVPKKIAVKVQE
jgi:HSP20 family protein